MLNKRKNLPQHKTIKKGECDMYRKKAIFKNLYLSIFCFVFSLFFSFSTPAFFSPHAQANCALPLYLSALQGGRGQVSRSAQLAAKKKNIIEPELKRIQEEIDAKNEGIDEALDAIAKRIGDYDDDDGRGYIADQIKEYIENGWKRSDAHETHCGDDDSSYYPGHAPSSFFAYFEAFKPPSDEIPVFNLAFLQALTKKSFHTLVPVAVADDALADANCKAADPNSKHSGSQFACVCTHDNTKGFDLGLSNSITLDHRRGTCPNEPPRAPSAEPEPPDCGDRADLANQTTNPGKCICKIRRGAMGSTPISPATAAQCPTPTPNPNPTPECDPSISQLLNQTRDDPVSIVNCECLYSSEVVNIAQGAPNICPAKPNCGPTADHSERKNQLCVCKYGNRTAMHSQGDARRICLSQDQNNEQTQCRRQQRTWNTAAKQCTNECKTSGHTLQGDVCKAPPTPGRRKSCGPYAFPTRLQLSNPPIPAECKCRYPAQTGTVFTPNTTGTNDCPEGPLPSSAASDEPAEDCGSHAGLISGTGTCRCTHPHTHGRRLKTFAPGTNGNCPSTAPLEPSTSSPDPTTPASPATPGGGTTAAAAPGATAPGGSGGGSTPDPVPGSSSSSVDDDEDEECTAWKQWGKCTKPRKKGIVEEKICNKPKSGRKGCRYEDGQPLNYARKGGRECKQALKDLKTLIKEIKKLEEEKNTLLAEVTDIDKTLRAIRTGTEADSCTNCDLKRLEKLKNIIDPAPTAWQTLGNVLGTVGTAALGLYGVRSANKLRDRQGFAAQPGYAVNLAMPFIMKGLYGGGFFGSSSSLACSPTLNQGGGNVFGNPFLMQQMMQAQQQQYMQQMYLMRIFQSSGQMVPGFQGGMMVPGFQGGQMGNMMGNMMVPGWQGGQMGNMMGNMMVPGFQGNIMGSLPGFQGNIVAGWMISTMAPSFQGGQMGNMMGNMMVPGWQGGGMMGQMMGGGMQSYFQYQQAMMAWRQARMADQMQRYQATSGLRMQIQQLQMQMYNILNGGGSYTGGMTTTTTTGGGMGGGRTTTGSTDGEVIIRGI